MNFLCVVVLLIVGTIAQSSGSLEPSEYGAGRGGPRGAGRPPHGGGRPVRPPFGPPGGEMLRWGKPLNPNNTSSLQFTAVFRADNVTLQNVNVTLPIKQGESIFLLPSPRGPPPQHGRRPPQPLVSYVKILYNSNSTTPYSFEFGVAQHRQSAMIAVSDSDEDVPQ